MMEDTPRLPMAAKDLRRFEKFFPRFQVWNTTLEALTSREESLVVSLLNDFKEQEDKKNSLVNWSSIQSEYKVKQVVLFIDA